MNSINADNNSIIDNRSTRSDNLGASLSFDELKYVTDVSFYFTTNALNVVVYFASAIVSIVIGFFGMGRDIEGSMKEVHDGEPTLVTPVFFTYSTWIIIYVLELFFVIAQHLQVHRKLPIIQDGVSWHFFLAHCFHIAWVVSYCFHSPTVATCSILINVVFLYMLCLNIYSIPLEYQRPNVGNSSGDGTAPQDFLRLNRGMDASLEFLLFRFPFHVHLGWASVMLLVNVNELVAYYEWGWQSTIAFVSLGGLWFLGTFPLFYPNYPNFTIPLIVAWGAIGIWVELTPANQILIDQFPYTTIRKIRVGAIVICIEHILLTVIRFLMFFNFFSHINHSETNTNRRMIISSSSF